MNIKQRYLRNLKNCTLADNEDVPVIDFIETLNKNNDYLFLEVGSGLCRFVDKIKKAYPNIHIICLEINPKLAQIAKDKGFNVINTDLLDNTLATESFDIIHCSHVIEHFPYPEVTKVIDEFLRIVKKNGVVIIRSPLLWSGFYGDIDHIKPYPPAAIIRYFKEEQQQKKSDYSISILNIWQRTFPKEIPMVSATTVIALIPPLKFFVNIIRRIKNKIYLILWNRFRCPATEPNGYVLILRKQ